MSRSWTDRISLAAAGATLTGALVVLAAPAAVAAPMTAPGPPVVTPTSTTQGSPVTVTVTGTGCSIPGSAVPTLASAGVSFGESGTGNSVQPNRDGTWTVQFELSKDTPAGNYPVVASCATYYGTELFAYPGQSITVAAAAAAATETRKAAETRNARGVVTVTAEPGQSLTPGAPAKVGERRTLRLTGYLPGEKVTLVLHSTPRTIGTFTAGPDGVVEASFIAPAGTPAGDHTLKVTRADGSVVSYPITLSAEKLTAAELAATGADTTVPLVGGIVLVLAGAGLTYAGRRRSSGAVQA